MTDEERMAAATKLFASWSSKAIEDIGAEGGNSRFAGEMAQLSLDNVFARLWIREGLDLRARSLLTLGILIALRAYDELLVHFPIAVKNGCTIEELEEVIYHATAYAGFPAANVARRAALETLRREKVIE